MKTAILVVLLGWALVAVAYRNWIWQQLQRASAWWKGLPRGWKWFSGIIGATAIVIAIVLVVITLVAGFVVWLAVKLWKAFTENNVWGVIIVSDVGLLAYILFARDEHGNRYRSLPRVWAWFTEKPGRLESFTLVHLAGFILAAQLTRIMKEDWRYFAGFLLCMVFFAASGLAAKFREHLVRWSTVVFTTLVVALAVKWKLWELHEKFVAPNRTAQVTLAVILLAIAGYLIVRKPSLTKEKK